MRFAVVVASLCRRGSGRIGTSRRPSAVATEFLLVDRACFISVVATSLRDVRAARSAVATALGLHKRNFERTLLASFLCWQITGHACAALFFRFDFQSSAYRSSPIIHDVKTQALVQLPLILESDAVIDYAQSNSFSRSLQLDHNFPGLGMFVRVDYSFPRDAIE